MRFCTVFFAFCAVPVMFAATAVTPLLHTPTMNRTQIVFSYAGDLWTVGREGGAATRLTAGAGIETAPVFSPDGQTIAFTGEYDGNIDVYTIPVKGGVPKRITYHPAPDRAVGWTPDGQRILFRSDRDAFGPRYTQLYTVAKGGGIPEVLRLPMAFSGAWSPDGRSIAYAPLDGGQFDRSPERWVAWKRYRGGEASYVCIANIATLNTQKIPRADSNDMNPMWIGDKIYFLSDRNGPMMLFSYDPARKTVNQLIDAPGPDIRSASPGPGGIVFEQFGRIQIYDLASGKTRPVPIEIRADLSEVRPRFQNVEKEVRKGRISPTGVRAVFEAHGEIVTVPAERGDSRNLTGTPGIMERDPTWSPDGKSIAYFSDESGEYALHVMPEQGGAAKKIRLQGKSAFYNAPVWSPDSKRVVFADNQLNLWIAEIASGQVKKVDTAGMEFFGVDWDAAWAPDSKWIAYAKVLPNRMHALFLYSIDSGTATQLTDIMTDARFPAFDRNGQYLFFTGSTNYGPASFGLDMTSDEHRVTRGVYVVVLPAGVASPVLPQDDEEKLAAAKPDTTPAQTPGEVKPTSVRIDLTGIQQRIAPVPIPARDYQSLVAGKAGQIYLLEDDGDTLSGTSPNVALSRFDLKTRKTERLAEHVKSFDLSANGEKMLLSIGRDEPPGTETNGPPPPSQWIIVSAGAAVKPGEGLLHLSNVEVKVDPIAEWKQMYHDVWRIERSFFYDPKLHGLDADATEKKYEPYLDSLASRDDLNYIFQEMLADITASHLRGGGGTIPRGKTVPGGLLGADFEIADGHYRFRKIYRGDLWDPQVRAPLTGPGMDVKEGEYLFAINGHVVDRDNDVYAALEGTAGKRVLLRIGADASGANAREVTVIPVASEHGIRRAAWIEGNRHKVDELSGGKLAYVYMPDTAEAGLRSFNRYFFAQTDKQGVILDERYNSGGQVADYVIEVMNRQLLSFTSPRYGAIPKTPAGSIQGPKVMIINELAGSGGDMMPWMFRYAKTGTLVGKRTWGGLIGVGGYPLLMDGGFITAPRMRIFDPSGEWIAENTGVKPDVEVELEPKAVAEGHDPQLERAVSIAMEQLKKNPAIVPHRPAYPDYQHSAGASSLAARH